MIRSMTGYGMGQSVGSGKKITLEIKGINHRYTDIALKVPRGYGYIEDTLRKYISSAVARGKLDVIVTIEATEAAQAKISCNTEFAKDCFEALKDLKETLGLSDEIRIEHLIRFPDVFHVVGREDDTEEIIALAREAVAAAVDSFVKMRETEGARLAESIREDLCRISAYTAEVEKAAPNVVKSYTESLRERMTEILEKYPVDEGRLLNEVAVFSDKVNINEEIVRLKSHIKQMETLLCADGPVGKKLDFLLQEMNRETNTIGAKANDTEIIGVVIELKACIEKVREQIQNIE